MSSGFGYSVLRDKSIQWLLTRVDNRKFHLLLNLMLAALALRPLWQAGQVIFRFSRNLNPEP